MLQKLADVIAFNLLALSPGTRLGQAVHFFIYDIVKIFFLLSTIIFVVALIRSYFPPEKARRILSHKREYIGNFLAALLGVVTPFCSCSAVPLFIGFVESGIPLGVTFSFLISSPMVNEVALVLLWGLFGWKISVLYISTGVMIAVAGGMVIGRFKMERFLQDRVRQTISCQPEPYTPIFKDRLTYAKTHTLTLLKDIWLYVVIGIAVGGAIHGYVPTDFLTTHAGRENIWAVPLAVLMGVPLYGNCGSILPVVQALVGKGLPLGTSLAFMMAVTALSFPEALILKKVLKMRLLLTFFGIVALSIILVGYLFNAVL